MNSPRAVHGAIVAVYLSLIGLLLTWLIWLTPLPPRLIVLAVALLVGPLLIALRGVLQARRYTLGWTTMLILLYFVHGVAAMAGGGGELWLGAAEVVLSLAYFVLAIRYVRITRTPTASG